jgi:hypothetical protein
MTHILGRASPGLQLGWVVLDLSRACNCVLWAGLLGTTQIYTCTGDAGEFVVTCRKGKDLPPLCV